MRHIASSTSHRSDYCVVTTLQDCIGLLVIIRGFCLVDVPSDTTQSILHHDSLLEGFHLFYN